MYLKESHSLELLFSDFFNSDSFLLLLLLCLNLAGLLSTNHSILARHRTLAIVSPLLQLLHDFLVSLIRSVNRTPAPSLKFWRFDADTFPLLGICLFNRGLLRLPYRLVAPVYR